MKWMFFGIALVASSLNAAVRIDALAGNWISAGYAKALEETRSPIAVAAREIEPVAFSIVKSGATWRLEITNYHEGTWRTIESLRQLKGSTYELVAGPYETVPPLNPKELKRFALEITADAAGKALTVSGRLWDDEKGVTFRRLDVPVIGWAGKVLLGGRYRDANKASWNFNEDGSGNSREGSFRWEAVLDTSEACTDYMILRRPSMKPEDEDRVAYSWSGGKLRLSKLVIDDNAGCPMTAAREPFAVLTPSTAK